MKEDSINSSTWMYYVSKYLEFIIDFAPATSIIYFTSAVRISLSKELINIQLINLLIFLFGYFMVRVTRQFVLRIYKPNFINEEMAKLAHDNKLLVLNNYDYQYRLKAEQKIYINLLYYSVSLILALVVNIFLPDSSILENIMLGLLGLALSIILFFCLAIISSKDVKLSKPIKTIIIFLLSIPLIIYTLSTLI